MENNLILKRFFTIKTLNDLLERNSNSTFDCVVRRYIKNPDGKKIDELISEIYTYLGKEYRTEYLYKNTILNKLLFERHDYRKTIALTELPVGKSKADFIMINGKGVAYEIKTELDNLDRLDTQIADYYKAFNEVVVVTYRDNIARVISSVPSNVGIIELTKRQALKVFREPKSCNDLLDYYAIFKILRKSEFENILLDNGIDLPDVIQFDYYKTCFKLFKTIEIKKLQKEMLAQLKNRMKIEVVEFSKSSPSELRFLTYFNYRPEKRSGEFETLMKMNYGG